MLKNIRKIESQIQPIEIILTGSLTSIVIEPHFEICSQQTNENLGIEYNDIAIACAVNRCVLIKCDQRTALQ